MKLNEMRRQATTKVGSLAAGEVCVLILLKASKQATKPTNHLLCYIYIFMFAHSKMILD